MDFFAQMTWTQWFLAVLLIFVCAFLMIVILLQRGRGGGLAGAFGGAGGTAAFGAKTGDVFTWITVVTTGIFLFLAVVSNYAFDQSAAPAVAAEEPFEQPAEAPLETPATGQPDGNVQGLPVELDSLEVTPADGAEDEPPPADVPAGTGADEPASDPG